MRIACPYCGDRSNAEFTYLGDAAPRRPDAGVAAAGDFFDYVYIRRNPPGTLREWWQHTAGCRAWLTVDRNITTHEITGVAPAQGIAMRAAETARQSGETAR